MITNVKRLSSPGDIQRYIRYTIAPEKDQKNEHYIHGERTMDINTEYLIIGVDVERNKTSHDLTNQIMDWNKEKRNGKKLPASPAYGGVISFDPEDTERFMSVNEKGERYLDTDKVIQIAKEGMQNVLGEDRPMYLALHGDKEHLHVHFVAASVDSQGKIFNAEEINDQGKKESVRDYRLWELANEALEIKYELKRVDARKAMEHEGEHRERGHKRRSNAAIHIMLKTGELTPTMELTDRIASSHSNAGKRFDTFLDNLEANGVYVKPNLNSKGVNGLSFSMDGMDSFIKASNIGNKYKWAKLEKDLNYDSTRDYQRLVSLKASREDSRTPGQHSPAVAEFDWNLDNSTPRPQNRVAEQRRVVTSSQSVGRFNQEGETTTRTETENTMANLSTSRILSGGKSGPILERANDDRQNDKTTRISGRETGFFKQEVRRHDEEQEQIEEPERIEQGINAWADPHLQAAQSLGMEDIDYGAAFDAIDSLTKRNLKIDRSVAKRYDDPGHDFS